MEECLRHRRIRTLFPNIQTNPLLTQQPPTARFHKRPNSPRERYDPELADGHGAPQPRSTVPLQMARSERHGYVIQHTALSYEEAPDIDVDNSYLG